VEHECSGSIYFPPDNWISSIFERHYPLEVWEERVKRLRADPPGSFEYYATVETLLMLVENYATTLVASLCNPAFRWLAAERFASSAAIGRLTEILSGEDMDNAWERLLATPEFISLKTTSIVKPERIKIWSALAGNPAGVTEQGKLHLKYEPRELLRVVEHTIRFRDRHRRLINAVKHGYRLPQFREETIDQIIADQTIASASADPIQDPADIKAHIRQQGLTPVFWLFETPEGRDRSPHKSPKRIEAELRLYGISYERALEHCQLVLDLTKLLFDDHRDQCALDQSSRNTCGNPFSRTLEVIAWIPLELSQPQGDKPYTVRGFAPRL